jgi:hypothetical protein
MGSYGKQLLKNRGELIERSFAHCYETGAMRRTHLRGRENVLKRQLIHVGAFNLALFCGGCSVQEPRGSSETGNKKSSSCFCAP